MKTYKIFTRKDAIMQLARGNTSRGFWCVLAFFFSFDSCDNLTKENLFLIFLVSIYTLFLLKLLLYAEFEPFVIGRTDKLPLPALS